MSLKSLEAAILIELKRITGNNKFRQKDIMEWSTGEIKPQEGETVYHLPMHQVYVAVKVEPKAK
jgi:hypothetical protein